MVPNFTFYTIWAAQVGTGIQGRLFHVLCLDCLPLCQCSSLLYPVPADTGSKTGCELFACDVVAAGTPVTQTSRSFFL